MISHIIFKILRLTQRTTLVFLVIFGIVGFCIGQKVQLTEQEFNTVFDAAIAKLSGRAVRITEKRRTGGGNPTRKIRGSESDWIVEILPPDRKRALFTLLPSSGGYESERIWIGSQAWKREKGTDWVRDDTVKEFENKETYRSEFVSCFRTEENLDGKKTFLYKLKLKAYGPIAPYTPPLPDREYELTSKVWLSTDGLLLRFESTRASAFDPRSYYKTITYEYDPKDLKIEAPKMN